MTSSNGDTVASPRLTELLRMRRFLDTEIAAERQRLAETGVTSLIQSAADMYATTVDEIRGASRNKSVTNARMVACWLLRASGLSYPEIGRMVARDHSTAMHACRAIETDHARLAIARQLLDQERAA